MEGLLWGGVVSRLASVWFRIISDVGCRLGFGCVTPKMCGVGCVLSMCGQDGLRAFSDSFVHSSKPLIRVFVNTFGSYLNQ